MNKKQVAAIALTLWLSIVFIFMLLLQRFDLEIFFVLTLIGVLVIAELIKQHYVQPGYLRYLSYLIGAGILLFCVIVINKVMEILAK
jgi:hypothetical protein